MKGKIFTPTLTIFDDNGNIDDEGNKKLIEYLIDGGVDGLVPLGSSGEFTQMTLDEKKHLIKLYVDTVDNRVELIPGTNSMNIEECIELGNFAIDLGVKGVLILPPYYYGISQDEAYDYFDKLAEEIHGNIYIYNFVARTGFDISGETAHKLAMKHKNIKGVKDSTASLSHTKEIILKVLPDRPDFEVFSGFDDHFIPNIVAGGAGCIAAISNFEPKLWSDWVDAMNNKDFDKVFEIGRIIDNLMPLYNVQSNFQLLFKKFLQEKGLDINSYTKFPFGEISDEVYDSAKKLWEKHTKE